VRNRAKSVLFIENLVPAIAVKSHLHLNLVSVYATPGLTSKTPNGFSSHKMVSRKVAYLVLE